MATLHDGDPYTSALVEAFADAFSALGGEVPAGAEIGKGATDMTDVLVEFAAAGPDAIFFPLFVTEGSAFAAQARTFDGLEGTTLISAGALLVSAFLETPQSEGMYFAGPESDFRSNVSELTGRSGNRFSPRTRPGTAVSPVALLGTRLRCDHHPSLGHRIRCRGGG